jgi:hypothetical protein
MPSLLRRSPFTLRKSSGPVMPNVRPALTVFLFPEPLDAHGPRANARAFHGFLGLSVISGMLVCSVYLLVCVGALRTFARTSVIGAAAAVVGIGTCLLAILAQFIDGTGPEPDYAWGRTLSIVTALLLAAWAASMNKEVVERVAQHTIEH